jgi:hypothetical protein
MKTENKTTGHLFTLHVNFFEFEEFSLLFVTTCSTPNDIYEVNRV